MLPLVCGARPIALLSAGFRSSRELDRMLESFHVVPAVSNFGRQADRVGHGEIKPFGNRSKGLNDLRR